MANMRTASLKVNVTPELYLRLKELAHRQGQTAAVLASVAIGQYVNAHMAPIDAQRDLHSKVLEMVERMPQQLLELEEGKKP